MRKNSPRKNVDNKNQKAWSWKEIKIGALMLLLLIFVLGYFASYALDFVMPEYVIREDRMEIFLHEVPANVQSLGGRTNIWFLLFGGTQVRFDDIVRIELLPYSARHLSLGSRRLSLPAIDGLNLNDLNVPGSPARNVSTHGYRNGFYVHVSRRMEDAPTLLIMRHTNVPVLISFPYRSEQTRELYRDLSSAWRVWQAHSGSL